MTWLLNRVNVDAQYELANDVQSNEDEANVEHVEAKEVATVSRALVSTQVQMEIWATCRRLIDRPE